MADNKDPFSSLGFEEDSHSPEGFIADHPEDQLPKEEPSQLLAAERGAEQGLSMGFSDELRGGLEAIPGAIQGEGDLADLYRQYRDIERSKLKELQGAHPWTYGGAELASGALVPGMGMAKGATLAKTIGRGMMAGGLTGAGVSEGDLTKGEVAPVAIDATVGAGLGGIGGAAGGLLGKAAGKAGPKAIADESSILTKMSQAYKMEKGGTPLTSLTDQNRAAAQMLTAAEDLKGQFDKTTKKVGKELGNAYKEAEASGLNLKDPVVNEMTKLKQELQDLAAFQTSPERKAEVSGIIKEIDNLLMEEVPVDNMLLTEMGIDQAASGLPTKKMMVPRESISPLQLKEFRELMKGRGVIAQGAGFDTFPTLTGKASNLSQTSSTILKDNVPGAKELSAKSHASQSGEELLNMVNGLFERKDLRNTDQVAALIANLEKNGIKGQSTTQIMNSLRDKAMAAGNPELAQYIEQELPQLAQEYDLTQAIGKKGFKEFGQTLEGLGIRGSAMVGKVANKLPELSADFKAGLGLPEKAGIPSSIKKLLKATGSGVKTVLTPGSAEQRGIAVGREAAAQAPPKRTAKPAQLSKSLYDSDNATLSSASDKLITSDNTKMQDYGKSLKEAVESGNSQLRNAVLFQISQDPKARELINQ